MNDEVSPPTAADASTPAGGRPLVGDAPERTEVDDRSWAWVLVGLMAVLAIMAVLALVAWARVTPGMIVVAEGAAMSAPGGVPGGW